VTCGAQTLSGGPITLTTPGTLSGTVTVALSAKPPGFLGAQTLLVEYGTSEGSLTQSASAACPSGCTVSLAGLTADMIYYVRRSWKDSGDNVIRSSFTQPLAVR